MARRLSDRGLDLIKRFEGLVDGDPDTPGLQPYPDPIGLATIGWGHLIRASERAMFADGITLIEAEMLLTADAADAVRAVNAAVAVPLSQGAFDALVSFTFNLGAGALRASTLLEVVNDGRHLDVPAELIRWRKAGGRVLRGLLLRRLAEARLYLS